MDHAAVTRLYSGKTLSPRLIGWAFKLQEYNLVIKHTPRKKNVVADALSRINLDENRNTDPGRRSATVDVPQRQQQEPAIMATKSQKQKAPPPEHSRRNKRKITRGGGIKRKNSENTSSTINKRPKHNGQCQPKVAKRTAETSERSLRSKHPRLQPEDQRPEYSRSPEQRRTRAQEQRTQPNKRRADHLPPQRKYPRME
ncbi:hypothetical protein X975_07296, partial [Stegodyphus mimosarum]